MSETNIINSLPSNDISNQFEVVIGGLGPMYEAGLRPSQDLGDTQLSEDLLCSPVNNSQINNNKEGNDVVEGTPVDAILIDTTQRNLSQGLSQNSQSSQPLQITRTGKLLDAAGLDAVLMQAILSADISLLSLNSTVEVAEDSNKDIIYILTTRGIAIPRTPVLLHKSVVIPVPELQTTCIVITDDTKIETRGSDTADFMKHISSHISKIEQQLEDNWYTRLRDLTSKATATIDSVFLYGPVITEMKKIAPTEGCVKAADNTLINLVKCIKMIDEANTVAQQRPSCLKISKDAFEVKNHFKRIPRKSYPPLPTERPINLGDRPIVRRQSTGGLAQRSSVKQRPFSTSPLKTDIPPVKFVRFGSVPDFNKLFESSEESSSSSELTVLPSRRRRVMRIPKSSPLKLTTDNLEQQPKHVPITKPKARNSFMNNWLSQQENIASSQQLNTSNQLEDVITGGNLEIEKVAKRIHKYLSPGPKKAIRQPSESESQSSESVDENDDWMELLTKIHTYAAKKHQKRVSLGRESPPKIKSKSPNSSGQKKRPKPSPKKIAPLSESDDSVSEQIDNKLPKPARKSSSSRQSKSSPANIKQSTDNTNGEHDDDSQDSSVSLPAARKSYSNSKLVKSGDQIEERKSLSGRKGMPSPRHTKSPKEDKEESESEEMKSPKPLRKSSSGKKGKPSPKRTKAPEESDQESKENFSAPARKSTSGKKVKPSPKRMKSPEKEESIDDAEGKTLEPARKSISGRKGKPSPKRTESAEEESSAAETEEKTLQTRKSTSGKKVKPSPKRVKSPEKEESSDDSEAKAPKPERKSSSGKKTKPSPKRSKSAEEENQRKSSSGRKVQPSPKRVKSPEDMISDEVSEEGQPKPLTKISSGRKSSPRRVKSPESEGAKDTPKKGKPSPKSSLKGSGTKTLTSVKAAPKPARKSSVNKGKPSPKQEEVNDESSDDTNVSEDLTKSTPGKHIIKPAPKKPSRKSTTVKAAADDSDSSSSSSNPSKKVKKSSRKPTAKRTARKASGKKSVRSSSSSSSSSSSRPARKSSTRTPTVATPKRKLFNADDDSSS